MPSRSKILFLTLACGLVLGGCGGCGDGDAGNPESQAVDYDKALAGAPPKLAALYAQGDALIPGALAAYEGQLADLEGTPVVANLWASWCGPCRFEFPYFQSVAAERGKEVAFLGVDSDDSDDAARTFLDELPLPYPSVTDPDKEVFNELGARGLPATAFYDASGALQYLHQGPYTSAEDLAADIDKYTG
jgi:thiol-disulfide isomerase/thioredoxin